VPADRPIDIEEIISTVARDLAGSSGPAHDLLVDYLTTLVDLVLAGRQPGQDEIDAFRRIGAEAAREAMTLGGLIPLVSGATRRFWPGLPEVATSRYGRPLTRSEIVDIGILVWGAADVATKSVIQGYNNSQRRAALDDGNLRHAFFANVVDGTAKVTNLVEMAEQVAFHPAVPHFVTVVDLDGGVGQADRLLPWLEASLHTQVRPSDLLVTDYNDQLVTVVSARPKAARHVTSALSRVLDSADDLATRKWRAGVGRTRSGLRGIQASYLDACEALDLARRLDSTERIVRTDRLLLYRVLLRDNAAMADLVRAVLSPLTDAHNGAEPLVETLDQYFASTGVLTDAARNLHLSVRAVSYRLSRIHELTGYDINRPMDRLALHLAVMGARLLDWPRKEITELD
jgi:hypothetical protein